MINIFCVRPKRFNVGNEAIALAVRSLLRSSFDGPINLIPIPAIESEEEGSFAGLTAKTIHEMNLYGHGVVVGGGNLYENGNLDVDIHALRRLQPPLMLFSLSHGRIYDHRHRLTARTDSMPDDVIAALNERAVISLVRDDSTRAHLEDLGASPILGACPTLLLNDLLKPQPELGVDPPSGALVSIRNPQLMSVPLDDQARVRTEVRRIIDGLDAAGHGPVRLLCHDKRDMGFASSLGEVDYILPDDVSSYLELVRQVPLLVSFRLHAFVPAMSFGTAAVNISYDERSLSLVRTIGLDTWDVDFVQTEDVADVVLDRCRRLDDLARLTDLAQPVWRTLEHAMRGSIDVFADHVRAYAAEGP